jgi:hypothetical protein
MRVLRISANGRDVDIGVPAMSLACAAHKLIRFQCRVASRGHQIFSRCLAAVTYKVINILGLWK